MHRKEIAVGGECIVNDTRGLRPGFGALPDGGCFRRARSRVRFPGTSKTLRVRNLALWLSIAAHTALLGGMLAAGMPSAPSSPPHINVEFVEIPGARGGGGAATQVTPGKPSAPAPAAKADAAPPLPSPQSVASALTHGAAAEPLARTSAMQGVAAGGQGSDSGSGGGQGSGMGASAGVGTGQGGVAVDRMPVPVRPVKPRYPMAARRAGQGGQVLLRLFVDQEGAVREVTVVRADPPGVFEDAALEAVRKWRFSPAVAHGAVVGMWMTLPVRFALDER